MSWLRNRAARAFERRIATAVAGKTELRPYERYAEFWDVISGRIGSCYPTVLPLACDDAGVPLRRVLDVACGSGRLAARLGEIFETVVGIDVSPEMLALAEPRGGGSVRFVLADFRSAQLPERFDAAVCAGDSLNYVRNLAELGQVFETVASHLATPGLFICDALTEAQMRQSSGAETSSGESRCYFRYYPATRQERSVTVFPDAFEEHRRIPLEIADVAAAASQSGFELLEVCGDDRGFEAPRYPFSVERRTFYVMRRRG
jgi:SAM-dependent methyltransferase